MSIRRLRPRLRRLRRFRVEAWQRNFYTILAAEVVAMVGFSISVPFLPFYIQELGVTDLKQVAFWVGLINSVAPISMAVASPIWGTVADRVGRKPMLVRAMLGGGVALALMSAVANVPQLAILRVIQGTLTGTVPAATALVATSVPRERTALALGLLQTVIYVGNTLGPFVGGVLGGALSYRAVFLAAGVLLSLAGVLVLLLVREEFEPPPPRKRASNPLASTARSVVREPMLVTMLGLLMLNSLGIMVTRPLLPLYVQTLVPTAKAASTATGLIVGATALSNAVSAVWVGRWADRLGRRRVLLACLAVAALVHFPQMFTSHPGQLLVLRVILGLALGGVIPVANAVIAERAPEGRQGGIYGISHGLNATGRALGPMLGTLVVTNWQIAGVFPVTGTILGLLAIMTAVRTRDLSARTPAPAERG